jgi:hypothetical protein
MGEWVESELAKLFTGDQKSPGATRALQLFA